MSRVLSVARPFAVLVIVCAAAPVWAQRAAQPTDHTQATATLTQLPIRFEPTDQSGAVIARGIGAAVRLSGTSIDFPRATNGGPPDSIRVRFAGARRSTRAIAIDPLPGRVNYLKGDDSSRWRTNVRTYARARSKDLYRGTDVLYYGAGDQLEYDLVVHPGAHTESIRLAVDSVSVAISDAGDLVYGSDDRVLLHKPIAYQTVGGDRREVSVAYRRREDGTIGFAVGPYDRRQILVIDPIIAYSFSFGGSGDEQVYDIAADETGAVYVGGETYSIDFPTMNPAQARDDAGATCVFYGNSICRDAFLAKLAADGKSLEYATYFGSDDFDQVNHIAVDSSHAVYFTGWTTTQTNSVQPDVRNSFIGKLAPDGSHFNYTYYSPRCCLSGPQLTINDLAIGPDGSAYVAVSTPATAEIATLSPAGDNYHSIYTLTDPSGTSRTSFNGIAVHGDSVYVGGSTSWSEFPTTKTRCCQLFPGVRSGVAMRLSLSGSVIYSLLITYRAAMTVTDVAVDRDGRFYVVGDMSDADTPCSPSSSPAHLAFVMGVSTILSGSFYFISIPYPFGACLLAPTRIAADDHDGVYTAGCGYGKPLSEPVARTVCNLWRVDGFAAGGHTFSDVPSRRFTIDSAGTSMWFAPINGQVSIIKLEAQLTLESLVAWPSFVHFGNQIAFTPHVTAEGSVETSFWRYDAFDGWREAQRFTPWQDTHQPPYSWTPGWWDAGNHTVCVFVRFAGTANEPQTACADVAVSGPSPDETPILPSAADFNADLRPDLIWLYRATGELAMWNLGGGEHGERVLNGGYLNAPPLPAGWRVAGAADINGDGQTDLVLQSDTGYLAAWFFNGPTMNGGTLLTPSQVSDLNWQIRAVGDLNHDGHPDLIWQYAPTGQVAFWLMNGTNAIGYVIPNVPPPGADWEIIGTGDSNRDGERDIFWQHRSTGILAVWTMMNGTQLASGSLVPTNPGDQWQAVAVIDLDGDAYSDVVLQNTNTGDLGAWYLRGTSWKFGALLVPSSVGTPGWSLMGPR